MKINPAKQLIADKIKKLTALYFENKEKSALVTSPKAQTILNLISRSTFGCAETRVKALVEIISGEKIVSMDSRPVPGVLIKFLSSRLRPGEYILTLCLRDHSQRPFLNNIEPDCYHELEDGQVFGARQPTNFEIDQFIESLPNTTWSTIFASEFAITLLKS